MPLVEVWSGAISLETVFAYYLSKLEMHIDFDSDILSLVFYTIDSHTYRRYV